MLAIEEREHLRQFDVDVPVEAAHQIRQKHEAPFKNADHYQIIWGMGADHLVDERVDPLGQGGFIEQDFFYIMCPHGVASAFTEK